MALTSWLQQYRKVWLLLLDCLLVSLAFFISFVMRFDWPFPPSESIFYHNLWPIMLVVRLTFFFLFEDKTLHRSDQNPWTIVHDRLESAECATGAANSTELPACMKGTRGPSDEYGRRIRCEVRWHVLMRRRRN